jgi:hypothetical protein
LGVADDERGAQRLEDSFGDLDGDRARVVFDDDDRELVAAEAGDEVVGTDAVLESGGQLDEKGVAALMTEGVVDVLEIVDVDEQHALVAGPAVAVRVNDAVRRSCNDARLGNPVSESWVARSVSAAWLSCSVPAMPLNASANSPNSSRRATWMRCS